MRRDGPTCAASKRPINLPTTTTSTTSQSIPPRHPLHAANLQEQDREDRRLFVTQIIPESWDTGRFHRFREMVSVFFACQFDTLLKPITSSSADMDVDMEERGLGNHSAGMASRSGGSRKGHYPQPGNILRSPRNAINLSEQWMRWFDEGRFVILERGGNVSITLYVAHSLPCDCTSANVFFLHSTTYVVWIHVSSMIPPSQDAECTPTIPGCPDTVYG
jgi:hypothetical protein